MSAQEPVAGQHTLALPLTARRWRLGGRVQGVGFRPFVYRLAQVHKLTGWVLNNGGEVEVHAQGSLQDLRAFGDALLTQAPPASIPRLLEMRPSSEESYAEFRILPSSSASTSQVHVPMDLFTCEDCLSEMHDPADRRYRYPFINCTQCGPRLYADSRVALRSMQYDA